MKCFGCQADNLETARFCTTCGTAIPVKCIRCGAMSPPGSRFCGNCGAGLSQHPQPGAAPTPADPIAASSIGLTDSRALGGERRQLTILFCDMVESSSLADSHDLENQNVIIRRYYQTCTDAIHFFKGEVANYLGDGVMALFGYPIAHEDDAERAIHAALAIVSAIQSANAENSYHLRVRIGIATGLVVIGADGPAPLTKEKTVVGEAPNFAAHLQAAAKPNTVLISETTRKLVGDVFSLKKSDFSDVKGAKRSVPIWRVLGKKQVPSRFAAHVMHLTDFVGRVAEVSWLANHWRQAIEGEGWVALLSGEGGIGKSRIVQTFRERIAHEARITMLYQCSPFHIASALHPVINYLEQAADIAGEDAPDTKLAKLEALLGGPSHEFQQFVAPFAILMSIPTGERHLPLDADPQRRKELILSAFIEWLAIQAGKGPILLILEDAHWADPTTLDLFARIAMRVQALQVFLIVTYRPEFKLAWPGPHLTALLLSRLGRRDCRAMVDSIAGKPVPPGVMDQIVVKADGVPLYVEELTKTVLESGWMQELNEAMPRTEPLPELAIPESLKDWLMARLDRLPAVKEVAQIAAAIGREFSYSLLAAVSSIPEEELQDALAKLAAAELIFPRGAAPAAGYVFKHALVQDEAYKSFLPSKQQHLHGRIANVLENQFPEIAQTQPEILAHHYTEARLHGSAVTWWRQAGDLAMRRSANREAVSHFRRAVDIVKQLPECSERDAIELAVRIKLSGPLIATKGYVSSELSENYARASELCPKSGANESVFPVMYGQWVIPYVKGDMGAALKNSEIFLRQAERQDDPGLLLMGHRIYGSTLVWRGDTVTGSEHLQRALSMYRPEFDQLAYSFSQHPRTAALAHLCLALQHLGHVDQAMAAGHEAISQAKRIDHFNSVAYALCFVSLLIMLRRDIDTLRETAGELLHLAKQHNASYWSLWAKPMLGWIQAQEGKIDEGIRQMHESTEKLMDQKANLWVPQTLLLEAEILGQVKEHQRAHRLLDEAQGLIEPLDQRFYEAELHRVRGVVMLSEGGDPDAVDANFDRAIEVARRQSSRFLELRTTVSKARSWLTRGRPQAAYEILDPVYRSFTEGLDTADLVEAKVLLKHLSVQLPPGSISVPA